MQRRHAPSASTRSTATAASRSPAASCNYKEEYDDPALAGVLADEYQQQHLRPARCSATARSVPLGVAFVQETTVFREFGPLAGSTMRLAYDDRAEDRQHAVATRRSTSTRATTCASAASGLLALRARGLQELGRRRRTSSTSAATPRCAATSTSSSSGRTRLLRQRRAPLPAHRGDADADRRPRRHPRRVLRQHRRRLVRQRATSSSRRARTEAVHADRRLRRSTPTTQTYVPVYGADQTIIAASGCVDGRASYGVGLETFALGFPIHFDWSWRRCSTSSGRTRSSPTHGGSSGVPQAAVRRSGSGTTSE